MDSIATFRSSKKKNGLTETRKEARETMRKIAIQGEAPPNA